LELQLIQNKIYELRGQKIMLDFDLAILYETETRILKQAVRRNMYRFPDDFMFELTKEEYNSLTSQIVILKNKGRGQHIKYLHLTFTNLS
jgi:ORF6N domain